MVDCRRLSAIGFPGRGEEAPTAASEQLQRELHELARALTLPALKQVIRLLRSEKFGQLTQDAIRRVGEYGSIELEGERFFEAAFSSGKEAAGSLGLATILGPDVVLEDLSRLRQAVSPSGAAPALGSG